MNRIDLYEQLAGKLLVWSARLRMKRGGADDAHEVRHLYAALLAGNSSPCAIGGADCHLDRDTMRKLHDATWPGHDLPGPLA